MIKRLTPKSEFTRNALKLMTGTGLAQAIPIAFAPILTRLYGPEDFGVLALYMSISTIMAIIATGRYEFAIMLPDKEKDSINIVILSSIISICLALIAFTIILFFGQEIAIFMNNPEIDDWLFFIPVSILFSGLFQAFNYLCNRKKQFGTLAKNRVLQTGFTNGTQATMGAGQSPVQGGLIYGLLLGQLISFLHLFYKCKSMLSKNIDFISFKRIKLNAIKYKKFPIFSSWGAVMNTSASQVPIFITSRAFGNELVGFMSLSIRVLSIPISLISTALSQVLYEKIISLAKNDPENLFPYILKLFLFLLILSSPLFFVMYFFGPEIFGFVFGKEWEVAGKLAGYLSISICFQFAVSPLSSIFILDHHLKKGVFWQTIYFISIITVLSFFSDLDFETFIKIYVAHEIVLYSLHLFFILYSAKRPTPENKGQ